MTTGTTSSFCKNEYHGLKTSTTTKWAVCAAQIYLIDTGTVHCIYTLMYDNETHDIRTVHNSAASRHGMILCVDIDPSRHICNDTEQEVITWLCQGLKSAHQQLDADNFWHFVHGVRHDQWVDRSGNRRLNGLQLTIYFAEQVDDGYAWPLFCRDVLPRPSIDVADVAHNIGRAPSYVRSLGLSAVSKSCLVHEWKQTVSTEAEDFCRGGSGFDEHAMYTLHGFADTPNPLESVENSCAFGWRHAIT